MKRSLLAALGAVWAAFLLPPQLVDWDKGGAPGWARSIAASPVYGWWNGLGESLGIEPYVWTGVWVAPTYFLIAYALWPVASRAGAWGKALVWATVAGGVSTMISYPAGGWPEPWNALWGVEAVFLLAMAVIGLIAGVIAIRRGTGTVGWMLAGAPLVIVASTILFTYYPHGTLIGLGLHVAVLAGVQQET